MSADGGSVHQTGRWLGLTGAALLAAAVGLVAQTPSLVLLGGVGAALGAYDRVAVPPATSVAIERSIEPTDPGVGESVTVRLTVRNEGDRTLPDVRVADGVPETVRVVDGTASVGTSLRPGASTTVTYEMTGGNDRCVFDPATVVVRDVVGVVARHDRVAVSPDSVTWKRPSGKAMLPLIPAVYRRPGQVPVDDGGSGQSFYAVRERRPNDPLSRVDWNRYARTGELTTVEFQREQAATVIVVVDTRQAAAVAPGETAQTAVERSTTAALALVEGLPEDGHAVGLAALSPQESWLPPGQSEAHRRQARDRIREDRAFTATPVTESPDVDRLFAQLPEAANVIFLSPLCDDESATVARRLAARGHPVTVVSPDATATDTAGHRLAHLERGDRLRELRAAGVEVYDWDQGTSLQGLLGQAGGGR
ncbi:DUF58 domain-containing protein [Haloarcula halophila]|uniref:DUF58 domain-containing protein n=1 Tax=Haloarcula TaxID=2237 RepID=UPI0023E3592E|nr:DUF58 domain-containing protein [Halomicroarcula sp. DFY41]